MLRAIYKKHIKISRQSSRTYFKASFPQTSEIYQIFINIFKFSFTYSDLKIKHKFGCSLLSLELKRVKDIVTARLAFWHLIRKDRNNTFGSDTVYSRRGVLVDMLGLLCIF
jgi:hypothetical protein